MKIKRIVILAFIFLSIIIFGGCKNTIKDTPVIETSPGNQEVINKTVDTTDPIELEKIWHEYLYYGITTVFNTVEYNSPKEIAPTDIVRFCCYKYIAEKGIDGLKASDDGSNRWLFPLDIAIEYAERYFNLSSLDLSKLSKEEYDSEKSAFLFNIQYPLSYTSYTDKNPWGIHLEKVTRNSDGTITAVLAQYDSYITDRIEMKTICTLGERKDGSLYFIKGKWDYVNNKLVKVEGNYTRFDKIIGYGGNMEELFMVGESEGKPIIAYTPSNKNISAQLMLLNPDTFIVEKTLVLDENLNHADISQYGDKLLLCFKDKITIVNKDFKKLEDISLPKVIRDKINREPKYDANGFPDIFFGGYDLSGDLTRIVYSDEEGLKLYNMKDNSEKLLSKTIDVEGSDLLNNGYHLMPRFVSEDNKVMAAELGYECIRNYTLYDLEKEISETLDISNDGYSGAIPCDTGMLVVNAPRYNEKTGASEYETLYLEFKTGGITGIKLEDQGETGYIIPDYFSFVGQNYAAFVTSRSDPKDMANNMYYINSLNLKTLNVEPKVISVKAAEVHIIGVLEDGQIIFGYNHNPSENGICITKKS